MSMPVIVSAQPSGPGPDPDPGPDPGGTSVPFDGGISLLVVAGVGYAYKKAYDKRKDDKTVIAQKEK